jgi:hypothetical protein
MFLEHSIGRWRHAGAWATSPSQRQDNMDRVSYLCTCVSHGMMLPESYLLSSLTTGQSGDANSYLSLRYVETGSRLVYHLRILFCLRFCRLCGSRNWCQSKHITILTPLASRRATSVTLVCDMFATVTAQQAKTCKYQEGYSKLRFQCPLSKLSSVLDKPHLVITRINTVSLDLGFGRS